MSKQITVYTLAELKSAHPAGYKAVHKRWERITAEHYDSDPDIMGSLRATIKACGGRLDDYSIGAWCHSAIKVTVNNETVDPETDYNTGIDKDASWLYREILAPLGYKREHKTTKENPQAYLASTGGIDFPGLCPFTGTCYDEDMIEHVTIRMVKGDTLTKALESLAMVASRMYEESIESDQSEETLDANHEENGENTRYFTSDGTPV